MAEEIARVLVYGDIHLNSKNYGAHNNYPKESLDCFRKITNCAEENRATHIIGLGDFTFGRFGSLEYREAVETELEKQNALCNNNRYEVKGNHDSAGYGMTEYEYYIKKGLLKPSCNIDIGHVHFTMVDSGKYKTTQPNIVTQSSDGFEQSNIILAHDYFKFKGTQLPDFGEYIELDSFTKWFGADILICGHIHHQYVFEGSIVKENAGENSTGHSLLVQYPGAMTRPSYREGHMDLVGKLILLTIYSDGNMNYSVIDVELLPLEESFNLTAKAVQKEKKEEKEKRVDISDIIHQLNSHERNIGNPEDIIMSMRNIEDKYKSKAVDLLKLGQA